MGTEYLPERERERERDMYILLFLLISPAFGMSISAKIDLARRTVSEVRDLKILLEDVGDGIRDFDSLEASVRKMQDLVEEAHQSEEIDLIQNWTNNAQVVSKKINRFPVEYLEKFQSAKDILKKSLDDLKNSAELAEPFLVQRRTEAVESLQEAEENIEILMRKTDSLQSVVTELQDGTNYLESYNLGKRNISQTRQELRELARRTLTKERELKILLKDLLQNNNNSVLFK